MSAKAYTTEQNVLVFGVRGLNDALRKLLTCGDHRIG
jgi:hypothetical protein